MRSQFVEVGTIEAAYIACPWAAEIVPVEGGFHAFESIEDYNRWLVNTDYEFTDIDLPGGQGVGVLLTEGGVVSGAGKIYWVFDNALDANAENADELALATIGNGKLTDAQKAMAARNSERLVLKTNTECMSFEFKTDSESGKIKADSYEDACEKLRDMVGDDYDATGAWGWVEDQDGNRLVIGEVP